MNNENKNPSKPIDVQVSDQSGITTLVETGSAFGQRTILTANQIYAEEPKEHE
jgi:hypothetical protein